MSDCSKQMNLHNVISAHRLARVHEANVQVRCALVVEAADRDGHRLDVQPVATEPRVLCRPPIALAAIAQVAVGVGEHERGVGRRRRRLALDSRTIEEQRVDTEVREILCTIGLFDEV